MDVPELDGEDDDARVRREATKYIVRKALIWLIPMALLGLLLVALGLPAWLVAIALAIAYAIVVFELDL